MTKLSYYLCIAKDGTKHLLYATSKREIEMIGEKRKIAFTNIEEQSFHTVKTTFSEKVLLQIRKNCKSDWGKRFGTSNINSKVTCIG